MKMNRYRKINFTLNQNLLQKEKNYKTALTELNESKVANGKLKNIIDNDLNQAEDAFRNYKNIIDKNVETETKNHREELKNRDSQIDTLKNQLKVESETWRDLKKHYDDRVALYSVYLENVANEFDLSTKDLIAKNKLIWDQTNELRELRNELRSRRY